MGTCLKSNTMECGPECELEGQIFRLGFASNFIFP